MCDSLQIVTCAFYLTIFIRKQLVLRLKEMWL